MNEVNPSILNKSLSDAIDELNTRLDALEANPKLKARERHQEYYSHSSVHGGNILKEYALLICASVDEEAPEYQALVFPLIQRIENFFAQPSHVLDFVEQVRLLRARRLIEQGKYDAANQVYAHIVYGPLYASAFEQRNHYFLTAAKNHLHLLKKLSHPRHVKHQLLQTLTALQYVREYPYKDDINLYQKAQAIFAQNYFDEAKIQIAKICREFLPEYVKEMDQLELMMVYKALLPYKHHLSEWQGVIRLLQKAFVSLLFPQQQFHQPKSALLSQAHGLLNEPTSTLEQLQHLFVKTNLEKNFISAMSGNSVAVQNLRQFVK